MADADRLMPREREVLRTRCAGLTTRQVADALSISSRTVDTHLKAAYATLGVQGPRGSGAQLVRACRALEGRRTDVAGVTLPAELSAERAAMLFGRTTGPGGVVYGFDMGGPVTQLWIHEGRRTGYWPRLVEVARHGASGLLFRFDGGWTVVADRAGARVLREVKG